MKVVIRMKKCKVDKITKYNIKIDNELCTEYKGKRLVGFGSSMTVKSEEDSKVTLYLLTDRGPNMDGPCVDNKSSKVFIIPDFIPHVVEVELVGDKAECKKIIKLRSVKGEYASGIPIEPGELGTTNEIALDGEMNRLEYDDNGLDVEGIAMDRSGHIWICDEYGPFIIEYDQGGNELRRFSPGNGIPDVFKERHPNRGFEALTVTPNGKIYAAVQSILDIKGETYDTGTFIRVLEINPMSGETREFAYPHDIEEYKRTRDGKIGDMYAISDNKILLIEQGKSKKGKRNMLYLIDISGADDISEFLINGKAPEYCCDRDELKEVNFIKKELIMDIRDLGWKFYKAEGLAVLSDRKTIFIINDNDFGVDIKVKDKARDEKKPNIKDYSYDGEGTFTYHGKKAEPSFNIISTDEELCLWKIELEEPLQ
ncbi:esterase-like activity of phytase family protein [Oceanirhabdus sp. W0125-5]|uniref:esterase-like activity of phytase family protein n=1 Tax=Oceanirhabdus sp. W0125-5 TaxID=2999116 RepID=UPI0022F2F7AF|nr:esterase-like activity of phytase family protein [Oceanirhabdus sp. W0125-5]WBW97828.1 esterase-like activity of phytase family protein [Oceanirhabdus sp. W0125-5]